MARFHKEIPQRAKYAVIHGYFYCVHCLYTSACASKILCLMRGIITQLAAALVDAPLA